MRAYMNVCIQENDQECACMITHMHVSMACAHMCVHRNLVLRTIVPSTILYWGLCYLDTQCPHSARRSVPLAPSYSVVLLTEPTEFSIQVTSRDVALCSKPVLPKPGLVPVWSHFYPVLQSPLLLLYCRGSGSLLLRL